LVAVGADWTDNRHALGYLNPLEKSEAEGGAEAPVYETTPILDLVLRATANPGQAHVLILDDMKLSHVERYFADFLSAMELSGGDGGELLLHGAGTAVSREGKEVPGIVPFPDNLFVLGTVNIDETTYMFSPKVLDRANVVEVRAESGEMRGFLETGRPAESSEGFRDYGVSFLEAARTIRRGHGHKRVPELPDEVRARAAGELMKLFGLLGRARYEFGFRTGREVMDYLRAGYFLAGPEDAGRAAWATAENPGEGWLGALDRQMLQKLLPKLHGSRSRLAPLLGALATFAATGDETEAAKHFSEGGNPPKRSLRDALETEGEPKFPASRRKLAEMIEILAEEQFVSFIC
jgi:5-methylcytosine-specific restriction protein B